MRCLAALFFSILAGTAPAGAQVLITGETGGAGGQAVMVTANRLAPKDFGTLANFWAQYGYGLSDRVDVFAVYGRISVFGDSQQYVGGGSNISLFKRRGHGLDVSFFTNATVPVTRRDQAATALATLALVASRPVTLGSIVMTPYGGFNTLLPIGHRERGVFTPVEALHTGIAGLAVPIDKAWSAYAEYNPGPGLQSAGVGILYVRPRQP